jgi:hypothetical protein
MKGFGWLKKIFRRGADKDEPIVIPEHKKIPDGEQALVNWGVDYIKRKDGTLFVPGNLNVSNRDMTELPDLSNVVVEGNFSCMHNRLTSLKGAPRGFSALMSDFGVFWEGRIPENLRNPPAHGPKPGNGEFSL